MVTSIHKGHDSGDIGTTTVSKDVPYHKAAGCLMYLVTGTLPDITYTVNAMSQKLDWPTRTNWQTLKHDFQYLKGTIHMGILFKTADVTENLFIYSDADYAEDLNTCQLTSGMVCQDMGGPIIWSSQCQKCVALSAREAEFIATSTTATETGCYNCYWK